MGIGLDRVQARIRILVAEFLQHRLSDPRQGFVTVVKVDLTPDYRRCIIHISILGEPPEQRRVMRMLEDATGLVQRHVAKALTTRIAPRLSFVLDSSAENSIRVESLFDRIAREREEREAAEVEEAGPGDQPEDSGEENESQTQVAEADDGSEGPGEQRSLEASEEEES